MVTPDGRLSEGGGLVMVTRYEQVLAVLTWEGMSDGEICRWW